MATAAAETASAAMAHATTTTPWIEKYRPQKLDDVAHQEDVVAVLRRTIETRNLPHLLFYGPPGTGKTSTILAVARELYGPEHIRKRVLELNASDERGIDVVRHRIKEFARVAVGKQTFRGRPCPPYKIIILDEADSMTKDAQSALRRIMEKYTNVTRFCIICNYVSRIIDPITSRCAKFRFAPLSATSMNKRLTDIAHAEHVPIRQEGIDTLITISEGDMRKSITLMQSARRIVKPGHTLQPRHVEEVSSTVPLPVAKAVLQACKAFAFSHLQDAGQEIILAGYAVNELFLQLLPLVLADSDLDDAERSAILIKMAVADRKLNDGADEYLQLMDVLATIASTIAN